MSSVRGAFTVLLLLGVLLVTASANLNGRGFISPNAPILPLLKIINANLAAESDQAACLSAHLRTCQTNFNRRLNITSSLDWTNYEVLQELIDGFLDKGIDHGLLEVCKAHRLFYQCLGAAYSSCINRFYFLQQGFDITSAAAYVEIFNELKFICNGGILQSLRSWDCILKNKQASKEAYDACLKVYLETVANDSNRICSASQQMIICSRVSYYASCGPDVGWWECERVRKALDIENYCPQLTCSYDLFPTLDEASLSMPHIEAVARRKLFRSPDLQFMSREKMALFASLGAKAEERMKRKKRSTNA